MLSAVVDKNENKEKLMRNILSGSVSFRRLTDRRVRQGWEVGGEAADPITVSHEDSQVMTDTIQRMTANEIVKG